MRTHSQFRFAPVFSLFCLLLSGAAAVLPALGEDGISRVPVAHWSFDTDADSSVGGWRGTLLGDSQVGAPDGVLGTGCYRLGKDSEGFLQTDFTPPSGSAPRSFSFWFKLGLGSTHAGSLFGWGALAPDARFDLQLAGSVFHLQFESNRLSYHFFSPGLWYPPGIKPDDNLWHHVLLSYAGGEVVENCRMFLDGRSPGIRGGTRKTIDTGTEFPLRIGAGIVRNEHPDTETYDFPGSIDDFAVFDEALDAEDAALIHGLGRLGLGLPEFRKARELWESPAGSTAEIGGILWERADNLPGHPSEFVGSLESRDLYLVVDENQSGLRMHCGTLAPPGDLSVEPEGPIRVSVGYGFEPDIELLLTNANQNLPVEWVIGTEDANHGDLAAYRESFDRHRYSVAATIPQPKYFDGGETGNHIESDEYNAMYESGNFLSFDGRVLDYANDGISEFATDRGRVRYFTRKYNGLFVLATELDGVDKFAVTGTVGGGKWGGWADAGDFTVFSGGIRWRAFTRQIYGKRSSSVCHLILVPDNPGISRTSGDDAMNEEHRISGLSSTRRLYHLLFSNYHGARYRNEVFRNAASAFLDALHQAPEWFRPEAPSGRIEASQSAALHVKIDALYPGVHTTRFLVSSMNAPPEESPADAWHPVEIAVAEPTFFFESGYSLVQTMPGFSVPPLEFHIQPADPDHPVSGFHASTDEDWLHAEIDPDRPDTIIVRFQETGMAPGKYSAQLAVWNEETRLVKTVTLVVHDPNNLNVVEMLPDPSRPDTIYAVNQAEFYYDSSLLLRIDAASAKITGVADVGYSVVDLALDRSTDRLYVASERFGEIRVVDLSTFISLSPIKLDNAAERIEADGNGHLYIARGRRDYFIEVLDLATLDSTRLPFRFWRGDIGVSPDGNFLYHGDINEIVKIDLRADPPAIVVRIPSQISSARTLPRLRVSGDGSKILFGGTVDDYVSLTPDLRITGVFFSREHPDSISHGGELVAGSKRLWWADGGELAASLPDYADISEFSSDGRHLLLFNNDDSRLHSVFIPSLVELPGPWPRPEQWMDESPEKFTWNPVSDAVSYKLVIDGGPGARFEFAGIADPEFILPEPLENGRIYHWHVDAETSGGIVPGDPMSFTVVFPAGPHSPETLQSEFSSITFAEGQFLVGARNHACLYRFDPATGLSEPARTFQISEHPGILEFGSPVALDDPALFVAAPSSDFSPDHAVAGAFVSWHRDPTGVFRKSGTFFADSPVAGEHFSASFAASGGLLLVGSAPETVDHAGRVLAYTTHPVPVQTQVLQAGDAASGDGFGICVALCGNTAAILKKGRGGESPLNSAAYIFARNLSTGRWEQVQKLELPGGPEPLSSASSMSMDETTLAIADPANNRAILFTRENPESPWAPDAVIKSEDVPHASGNFPSSAALCGDFLFLGDSSARLTWLASGAVFTFRKAPDNSWFRGATIQVPEPLDGFGHKIAVFDGWLLVPATLRGKPLRMLSFRIDPAAIHIPVFAGPVPAWAVAGRDFEAEVLVRDADGNGGLRIRALQLPDWLLLTDHGNGRATLAGFPDAAPGASFDVQLEARDPAGASALRTFRITLLSEQDTPVVTEIPGDVETSVGQEVVLRAAAEGPGPVSWQWQRNGVDIPGAVHPTFRIERAGYADAGVYAATATNPVSSAVFRPATVTVRPADRFAGPWSGFGGDPGHTGSHPAVLGNHVFLPAWQTMPFGEDVSLGYPAVAEGRVFVAPDSNSSSSAEILAIDVSTGAESWSNEFPDCRGISSPTWHDASVYLQLLPKYGVHGAPNLVRLNASDGAEQWRRSFGNLGDTKGAPVVTDDGIFAQAVSNKGILAFGLDGTLLFESLGFRSEDSPPSLSGDRLYALQTDGTFRELLQLDGTSVRSIRRDNASFHYSQTPCPAVLGDSAVIAHSRGVMCIDLPSGSIRWQYPGYFRANPTVDSRRAFAVSGSEVLSWNLADGTPGRDYQAPEDLADEQPFVLGDYLIASSDSSTYIFAMESGDLVQTLDGGGKLAYSDGYLVAAGPDGTLRAWFAAHPPVLDVAGTLVLNRQTGLYEHTITVTNNDIRAIPGFDLTVSGLPDGVCVWNASDCTGGPVTIQFRQPLAAGASTTLILEYYAPVRGTVLNPEVTVELVVEPESAPAAPDGGFAIDRALRQRDDSMLIEFTAEPGALYEVHYSADAAHWKLSPVRVRAAGNRVQWVDRGPPRTDTSPGETPTRFYRVRKITKTDN